MERTDSTSSCNKMRIKTPTDSPQVAKHLRIRLIMHQNQFGGQDRRGPGRRAQNAPQTWCILVKGLGGKRDVRESYQLCNFWKISLRVSMLEDPENSASHWLSGVVRTLKRGCTEVHFRYTFSKVFKILHIFTLKLVQFFQLQRWGRRKAP